jgi:hypothetical protein
MLGLSEKDRMLLDAKLYTSAIVRDALHGAYTANDRMVTQSALAFEASVALLRMTEAVNNGTSGTVSNEAIARMRDALTVWCRPTRCGTKTQFVDN